MRIPGGHGHQARCVGCRWRGSQTQSTIGGALEPDTSRPRHRQRAAQPEEIGRLAVFLASSDGDYVTGRLTSWTASCRWLGREPDAVASTHGVRGNCLLRTVGY